jgi:DNA-binding CsgD family transcriptional regulator
MTYDPVYAKRWRLDQARGIARTTDAKPVRIHIEQLAMEGASYRAIADAAGTSVQTICKVRDGQRTLRHETAAAILAVTYDSLFDRSGPEHFVPKVGACRRIRALMAIGHRAQDIAAAVGMDWHSVHNVLNQTGQWISRQRHEQIAAAYDALWNTPGTSRHLLSRAAAAGWAPPLAWDDDTIDDPNAAPDLGAPAPTDKQVYLEDIEFILDDQPLATAQAIADRLGATRDAVQQACRRADRDDLVERLARNAELRGAAA